jgi:diaminohydroxyphosphoribosylaminopyrimidine deaminase/5-amino-6-(5-phosphoribosylamino)uracil reductase
MFPLAGSFAGLPTLYGVIVRRRTAMGRMTGSRLFIYGMSRGDFEMWDRNRRNMLGTVDDMPQYRKYMTQALELAHKGVGWVNPNPLVGTVVVRDGEILAAGYHDRYRGPHAERMAFDYADEHGVDMHGATVIDTLEPCCHVGSQPACTDLILSHGITRVVVGSIDPNPIVAGKGLRILEENGVEVVYDVMRAECDAINRHFFHYITTGMGVRTKC